MVYCRWWVRCSPNATEQLQLFHLSVAMIVWLAANRLAAVESHHHVACCCPFSGSDPLTITGAKAHRNPPRHVHQLQTRHLQHPAGTTSHLAPPGGREGALHFCVVIFCFAAYVSPHLPHEGNHCTKESRTQWKDIWNNTHEIHIYEGYRQILKTWSSTSAVEFRSLKYKSNHKYLEKNKEDKAFRICEMGLTKHNEIVTNRQSQINIIDHQYHHQ